MEPSIHLNHPFLILFLSFFQYGLLVPLIQCLDAPEEVREGQSQISQLMRLLEDAKPNVEYFVEE